MKIIEALKKVKDLQKKAEDLRSKISKHSAHLSTEKPVYENQKQQIGEWLQAHSDLLKEILRLRICIQKTNLATSVTIELGKESVTKTIAEWVHRRRDLATQERAAWAGLTDRGLQETKVRNSQTSEITEITIVRYYDPAYRDNLVSVFEFEPSIIDAKLEVINAVTDLLE